mgnify:CR=1 FL=1
MNITDIIQKRRAVYPNQYENIEIEDSYIKLLLKNANTAPSHRLTQPWFFKVYKGNSKDNLANEMANAYEQFSNDSNFIEIKKKKIIDKCKQSNCVICIFMKEDPLKTVPEWEEIAATAMAVQNMWLTCAANNIGCYWSTPKYTSLMDDFFKLKGGERSLGFFYLGKFNHSEIEPKQRVSIDDKTEWNN